MRREIIQSEVFIRADIAAILAAIGYTAATGNTPDTPHRAAYRQGWRDALTAVALALHIADPMTIGTHSHERSLTHGGETQQRTW